MGTDGVTEEEMPWEEAEENDRLPVLLGKQEALRSKFRRRKILGACRA